MRFSLAQLTLLLTASAVLAAVFAGHLRRYDARLAELEQARFRLQQEIHQTAATVARHLSVDPRTPATTALDHSQTAQRSRLARIDALSVETSVRRARFVRSWGAGLIALTIATAGWLLIRLYSHFTHPTNLRSGG